MNSLNIGNSLYLHPTDEQELLRILTNIKTTSVGWDDINVNILKSSFHHYSNVLVHLVNMSLSEGVFPDLMKIAKIIPLYKNGEKNILNNYRPVSVLPVFSKLFERVIYNRLIQFVNDNDLLYEFQFGFRKKHNTTLALITLIDKIVTGINDNEMTLGAFLDFSKAFDMMDHNILMRKLHKYGIRGIGNNLIRNYLQNRKQYIIFNGTLSDTLSVNCGVPQGSILGPLLFILYVNDLHLVSDLVLPILFADDSSIFIRGNDIINMTNTLNQELNKIYIWINTNKLCLNINKTSCMLFKPRRRKVLHEFQVKIANTVISKANSMKFLGVVIDSNLSWDAHINFIRKKIAKGIGIINKAKRSLNQDSLLTLYHSFVYPYITYGIEVWGSSSKTNLLGILKLQNKILRIITFSPARTSALPFYKRFNLLNVNEIYIFKVSLFMFKCCQGESSNYVNAMFLPNSQYHDYETRHHSKLHIPLLRTSFCQGIMRYKGAIIWNYLLDHVPTCSKSSIALFKKHVKSHILSNENLSNKLSQRPS